MTDAWGEPGDLVPIDEPTGLIAVDLEHLGRRRVPWFTIAVDPFDVGAVVGAILDAAARPTLVETAVAMSTALGNEYDVPAVQNPTAVVVNGVRYPLADLRSIQAESPPE